MTGMPDRHRALMTLLAARSALSYEHISATLAIPVGNIEPIRARSLKRLQPHPEMRSLRTDADRFTAVSARSAAWAHKGSP
jgi:DNA-directed RNA polymerase specialized sigma24 family protein